jgi:hypothetical protein
MTAPRPIRRLLTLAGAVAVLALPAAGAAAPRGAPEEATVAIAGRTAVARSSSTLAGKPAGRYSVKNLFDGKLETAWVEGAKGDGKGEWVEVEFAEPVEVDGFLIAPGYGRSAAVFAANVAPLQTVLSVDGKDAGSNVIRYALRGARLGCEPSGEEANFAPRVVVLPKAVRGRRFRLAVKQTLRVASRKADDLAISEWQLLLADRKELPPAPAAWADAIRFGVEVATALRSETPDPRLLPAGARIRDLFAAYPGSDAASLHDAINTVLAGTGASPDATPTANAWAVLRGFVGNAVALRPWEGRLQVVGEAVFVVGAEQAALEYTPAAYADLRRPTRIQDVDPLVQRPMCGGQGLPEPGRER